MTELNIIQQLLKPNIEVILSEVFLIAIAYISIRKITDELIARSGYETQSMKQAGKLDQLSQNFAEMKEQQQEDIKNSIENDRHIAESIEKLTVMLEDHIETDNQRTIVSLRSTIWRIYEEVIIRGYTTSDELKVFEECITVYTAAGGNDIVHDKFRPEVLKLPIRSEADL